jgi:predicted Fe-Mo cluster-binding NifX family protein
MRIAVTIVKPEKTSLLSEIFGRSDFFLIYNTSDNWEEFLPNPFAKELGGAGIQSARFLIENKIDSVIVKQIGKSPFRFLASANTKVYQCKEGTAAEAIRLFNEGKLILIENINGDIAFGRKRKRYGRKFFGKKYINNKKGKI